MKKVTKISLISLISVLSLGSIALFATLATSLISQKNNFETSQDDQNLILNKYKDDAINTIEKFNLSINELDNIDENLLTNYLNDIYKNKEYSVIINNFKIDNSNKFITISTNLIDKSTNIKVEVALELKLNKIKNNYSVELMHESILLEEKTTIQIKLKNNSQEIINKDTFYYIWKINGEIQKTNRQFLETSFNQFGEYSIQLEVYLNQYEKQQLATISKKINVNDYDEKTKNDFNLVEKDLKNNLSKNHIEFYSINEINNENIENKLNKLINLNKEYKVTLKNDTTINSHLKRINANIKLKALKYSREDVYKNFDIEFNYKIAAESIPSATQSVLEKIYNNVTLLTINNDYKNITAKEFYKFEEWNGPNSISHYFKINIDEIHKLLNSSQINKTSFVFTLKNEFNFLNPTTVLFEIQIKYSDINDVYIITKEIQINDFKDIPDLIGELDKQPIKQLKTPISAQSYKGYLEKFKINDFVETGENAYRDSLNRLNWNDIKRDFMYQVRFALYQMFSDNFSEINYYIKNEVNEKRFISIGEGIIKESRKNVKYGFFYQGEGSGIRYSNLNSGDKVKVQINFDAGTIGDFKPDLLDHGGDLMPGFTESWFWNFDNNCNNLLDTKNPLFVKFLPRDTWVKWNRTIKLSISINNSTTYSENVHQYSSYNFLLKNKIRY